MSKALLNLAVAHPTSTVIFTNSPPQASTFSSNYDGFFQIMLSTIIKRHTFAPPFHPAGQKHSNRNNSTEIGMVGQSEVMVNFQPHVIRTVFLYPQWKCIEYNFVYEHEIFKPHGSEVVQLLGNVQYRAFFSNPITYLYGVINFTVGILLLCTHVCRGISLPLEVSTQLC